MTEEGQWGKRGEKDPSGWNAATKTKRAGIEQNVKELGDQSD